MNSEKLFKLKYMSTIKSFNFYFYFADMCHGKCTEYFS